MDKGPIIFMVDILIRVDMFENRVLEWQYIITLKQNFFLMIIVKI